MKFFAPLLVVALLCPQIVWAHDETQEFHEWYSEQRQPNNRAASCCGPGDAYWCDIVKVHDGKTFCTITDTQSNTELKRVPREVGTEIEIPENKFGAPIHGNPTGHTVVWLSSGAEPIVYCFFQGTLI